MSENDGNDKPQQPRQPNSMNALYKFAMEATKGEDTTHESHFLTMDPERKKFLEDALKSMTLNVVEELNKAMKTLMDENAPEADKVHSLEVVTNYVADIDAANDFFKIGGFCIILPCLNSEIKEIRCETALLIGELAQNNPYCQKQLLELNIISKLIEIISGDFDAAPHALHAISCMIRSYEPSVTAFIEIGGLECILGLLQSNDQEKIIIKTVFLISNLCSDFPLLRDEFIKLNAIEKLIDSIQPKGEYNTRLETTLSALNGITDTEAGILRCRDGSLNLKEKLEKVISLGKNKDECKEQIDYSQDLIERIFSKTDDNQDR
ncbi:unnamed protein product [Diamesa serratosioi]